MYDPLSSGFGDDDVTTPPWPTTPHQPNSPIPGNLRRAPSPLPRVPSKLEVSGVYDREPQIYGQPEPGLISPRENVGSNGTRYERPEPYLKIRISGLDRNRRDILVKLDAQVRTLLVCFSDEQTVEELSRVLVDELVQLHWHDIPERLALLSRVPAILRYHHPQQPTNNRTRTSLGPNVCADGRRG